VPGLLIASAGLRCRGESCESAAATAPDEVCDGCGRKKDLVRRFHEEVWDGDNVEFTHEVFADDNVRHDLRPTRALPGAAGMAKMAADFRRAFPDARWGVDILLGEGELVAGTVDSDRHTYRRMGRRRARWESRHLLRGEHLSVPPRRESRRNLERPGRPWLHGAAWGIRLRWSRHPDAVEHGYAAGL
jgi:hypothetical protein